MSNIEEIQADHWIQREIKIITEKEIEG